MPRSSCTSTLEPLFLHAPAPAARQERRAPAAPVRPGLGPPRRRTGVAAQRSCRPPEQPLRADQQDEDLKAGLEQANENISPTEKLVSAEAAYWTEMGGPAVAGPPQRRGFGTRLLERALAYDLGPGATVDLRFEPTGLHAVIRFTPGAVLHETAEGHATDRDLNGA